MNNTIFRTIHNVFMIVALAFLFTSFPDHISAQTCSNFTALPANTFINTTLNTPLTLTGVNVRISGNVTFNNDVTFIGCIIFMEPNATVTINPNQTTGLSTFSLLPTALGVGTTIFACNGMWRAINITSNTAVSYAYGVEKIL